MQNPWKDIVPYTKEDAARFKGRDEDIRKFSRILLYSDFSVLYAESGIGKTSFINAGIIPVFAASHYKDVIIQIPTEIYSTPVEEFRERFEQLLCNRIFEKSGLREVVLKNGCPNSEIQDDLRKSLWWRLHAYTYKTTRNGQEQDVEPFIIFDQFEEVFQKASPEILNELFRALADISSNIPPSDLVGKLKTYNRDELYDQIDNDIHFKVLFSLRKEYLAEFDHWTNTRYAIPEMLQNRMLLQSFTRQQAEEVITEQVLNGNAVDTLDLVKDNILSLFERRNADEQSNIVRQNAGYEAFLLSVICSRLYDFAQAKGIAQVTPKEMEGFNISSLILNFYEASIRDLSIPRQHLKVIEEELVDEWGDRNRIKANNRNLASIRFEKRYRKGLEDKHIIKNSDGYVELIHDRVAEAIFYKRKEVNKHQWAWLQRVALAILIVLMSCAAIYSGWTTTNPRGYDSRELRGRDELTLPKDSADFDRLKSYVAKLTIDNDDATMSRERVYYNINNLTDLKITGQKARPTNIVVADCNKLVNLSLSDSLTSFPWVDNCPNLHFLRLPANVESFPNTLQFLEGMDSVEFAIPEKTPAAEKYVWQDGILWSIADTRIIYAQKHADTVLCFPEGIHADHLKYDGRTFSQPKNKKPDLLIKGRRLVSVKLYDNTTLDLSQPQYDTIDTIGMAVFRNCKKLQSVKLPSQLRVIEPYAFAGCIALSEIRLPDSTCVWDYAFTGCHRLKQVHLSQGVNFIRRGVIGECSWYRQFDDCDSVTFVLPDANIPNNFSKDKNGILWCDNEPIFFNEVLPTCNHEDSLLYIRNGVVYRRGTFPANGKPKVKYMPWAASPKANTGHIIEDLFSATTFIINADSTEYVPPVKRILFRNPRKLTELHLSNCNYSMLPQLMLPDYAKSRITLYVPWGCSKYYEADSEYAAFKEIREDGWWRRLANLLTEMWQISLFAIWIRPILKYLAVCIVLLVIGVIYYFRFKGLLRHNSANRSRNVLRWKAALTAVSAVFFFVLTWMAGYWLVIFNWGASPGYVKEFLAHALGIACGILAVRFVVFYTTDWTALKRNIRDLVARIRYMTWQEWRQLFVDLAKALYTYLASAIRRFMSHFKIGAGAIRSFRSHIKTILLLLISALMIIFIGAFGIYWHRWSQEVSETINQLDGNEERESALYDKLSGRLMLLTPKQKGQLQDYIVNHNRINTSCKVLDSLRIGKGHADKVNSAHFSPDGKYIVTASDDHTAIVWEANTGDPVRTLNMHRGSVNSAHFSPDGKYIVTASDDHTAIVWDANTGDTIRTLNKHWVTVNSANFSPDGKYVVTASYDDTAIIWDANTGDAIRTLKKHRGSVNTANFSPDGKYVVTASVDGTAIVWNANTGNPIRTLNHKNGQIVWSANFSPDGKHIVMASSDWTAIVWDVRTGDTIRTLKRHRGSVNTADFSPDGKYIVTASWDDTAIVWDANTGNPIRMLKKHQGSVNSASFSPDSKYIVTTSSDNTAIVWDANTGDMIRSLSDIRSLRMLQCASDGSYYVAVAPYDGNKAVLLNQSWNVTNTVNHIAEIYNISFCPYADRFVTIGRDKVLVWAKRGKKRDYLRHVGVTDVSFSADGKRIISSSYKELRAWDKSGHLVDSLEKLDRRNIVYHLGIKRKMAVENADSLVVVYDLLKGDSLVLDSARYRDGVRSVCISPDGEHIVTAIRPMEGKSEVKAIVWSPDGALEQELKKLNYDYSSINDISYSWNGRYILGRMSGDCVIWDADSGMLLWRIDGDVMDFEAAKLIDANRELTFVTRERDIKRVRLLSLKEMIEMRRRQLNMGK